MVSATIVVLILCSVVAGTGFSTLWFGNTNNRIFGGCVLANDT